MKVVNTNFTYTGKLTPLNLSDVKYIIIHHTACEEATPDAIHQWHLSNGWLGFGYNEYIRKDGTVYVGRGDHQGSHTKGHNSDGYGIALEGNFDKGFISTIQYQTLVERVVFHKKRFENFNCVVPHNQFGDTTCPGKHFDFGVLLTDLCSHDKKKKSEHWADKFYKYLVNERHIIIHDKRFDDPISRGELFALLSQIVGYKERM